ncbi:hypothetical protein [Deinococcus roseus]|uniref:Uncharacterized protein n=1 Tax=Deinococcus roseus TaxID=392414 RepID=A0ABQ2DBD1_9DEIO|nr:hypothetical protein [Deinococcus roseus]GGJ52264.1 hypothetical protein GCM10008938_42840 [Deinococcus roseus]
MLVLQSCAPRVSYLDTTYPRIPAGSAYRSTPQGNEQPDTVLLPEGCQEHGVTYAELQKVGLEQAKATCKELDQQAELGGILLIPVVGLAIYGIWAVISIVLQALNP